MDFFTPSYLGSTEKFSGPYSRPAKAVPVHQLGQSLRGAPQHNRIRVIILRSSCTIVRSDVSIGVLEVMLHWAPSSTLTQPEERVFLRCYPMQVN